MTSEERARFEQLMKDFYKSKSEREERFALAVWNVATDIINEIFEAESDGSGHCDLRRFATTRIDVLKEALNERAGYTPAVMGRDAHTVGERRDV